jgi:hypothetical protein
VKHFALLLAISALLAAPAAATSKTQYHRLDRALEVRARASLAEQGLAGLRVRAQRGRLIVAGELPAGREWSSVRASLAATGAVSVHVAR